jgi:hypothetical protein
VVDSNSDVLLFLLRRVEAIEARQRDHGWHDPDCPVRQTQLAQKRVDSYLYSPPCDCWLKEDPDGD